VPIVPANLAYQGVAVPAGTHRLELRYRNPLLFAGAAISVVTVLLLLVPATRRRRQST
jgi:uncharacterized membrane protein YfhO